MLPTDVGLVGLGWMSVLRHGCGNGLVMAVATGWSWLWQRAVFYLVLSAWGLDE